MALDAGIMVVTVEYAKDLKDKDWFGKQDPYAILKVGGQSFRTKTHTDGGKNPVWNETFSINIINDNNIDLTIMDSDVGKDDVIGTTVISLAKAREQGSDYQQCPVRTKSGKQHGFVAVRLAFNRNSGMKAHGAPPPHGAPAQAPYPPQHAPAPGGYPPAGYPPQQQYAAPPAGYPPQHAPPAPYPPQHAPAPAGYPPAGYPPAGYPPQQHAPAGYPPQQHAPAGYPPAGYPPAGYPPQHAPPHGYPPPAAHGYPPAGGHGQPYGAPVYVAGIPPLGAMMHQMMGGHKMKHKHKGYKHKGYGGYGKKHKKSKGWGFKF